MNELLEKVRAERKALTAQQRSALTAKLLEVRKKRREAREEHSKRLALGVALVIGSSLEFAKDADWGVRGAVKNLVDGHHALNEARPPGSTIPAKISTPEDAFAGLSNYAKAAFSESPTDAEILANSATPDLVRYLLWALRAYDGKPANLATAFGSRSRAGTTEVWRLRNIFIPVADRAHKKQLLLGTPYAARVRAVVDAAYEEFVSEKKNKILPEAKGKKGSRGEDELRREILDILSQRYGWG